MPLIRPFRGILYDPAVAGSLDSVVAPPYDVISPQEQAALYEANPYNVIRLDLSRDRDRYGSACRAFHDWLTRGILARDPEPAYYVYAQKYRLANREERERWGFFARLHLEDFASGKVLPHEKTLASAKADRLELQRACRANLSSIFGLYSAPGWRLLDDLGSAVETAPGIEIRDRAETRHRLWRITEPKLCAALSHRLETATVYIADGHHRYETALRYRDELRAETGRRGGGEPFDFVLAFLTNMEEPGLVVLPTHRLLRELELPVDAFVSRLREKFRIETAPRSEGTGAFLRRLRTPAAGERRIGVVLRGIEDFLVLVTRDGENDARLAGSPSLRRLDVTLLHGLILDRSPGGILGLDVHHEAESGRLVYTKSDEEAVERVESGEFAAAFLLNSTRVDEVRAVCEAGETMPEKSTYFYPKLLTGLVFNSVADD